MLTYEPFNDYTYLQANIGPEMSYGIFGFQLLAEIHVYQTPLHRAPSVVWCVQPIAALRGEIKVKHGEVGVAIEAAKKDLSEALKKYLTECLAALGA